MRERPPLPRPPSRAPPRSRRARRARRARADCGPQSARWPSATALAAQRFRVVRPQPRPLRGEGGRTLRPRGDPGDPPVAHPGRGFSPSSPGRAPAAHVRGFKLFFEGLACPPRRKMPTEAAAGGGEEAASAFQTSQEFRTLRPHSRCPCG